MAITTFNLGTAYLKQEKIIEAENCFNKAQRIFIAHYGAEHKYSKMAADALSHICFTKAMSSVVTVSITEQDLCNLDAALSSLAHDSEDKETNNIASSDSDEESDAELAMNQALAMSLAADDAAVTSSSDSDTEDCEEALQQAIAMSLDAARAETEAIGNSGAAGGLFSEDITSTSGSEILENNK